MTDEKKSKKKTEKPDNANAVASARILIEEGQGATANHQDAKEKVTVAAVNVVPDKKRTRIKGNFLEEKAGTYEQGGVYLGHQHSVLTKGFTYLGADTGSVTLPGILEGSPISGKGFYVEGGGISADISDNGTVERYAGVKINLRQADFDYPGEFDVRSTSALLQFQAGGGVHVSHKNRICLGGVLGAEFNTLGLNLSDKFAASVGVLSSRQPKVFQALSMSAGPKVSWESYALTPWAEHPVNIQASYAPVIFSNRDVDLDSSVPGLLPGTITAEVNLPLYKDKVMLSASYQLRPGGTYQAESFDEEPNPIGSMGAQQNFSIGLRIHQTGRM